MSSPMSIGLCSSNKNVTHLIIPNPFQSLGASAKDAFLSIILLTHFTSFWFGLFPCTKTFMKHILSNCIAHCQPICLLHIAQSNCKIFVLYKSKKNCIAPKLQTWPSTNSLVSLFFFVSGSSNNKAMTYGCGMCTTNVVEKAFFHLHITKVSLEVVDYPLQFWSWKKKIVNNVLFLL